MQCYTDIIFFSFFLFFTEKPDYYEQKTEFKRVILRRSTNKDDFSLVKFPWVYHAEKSKQQKKHQKTPTYSRKKFLSDALFIDLFFMPSSKKKWHIALLLCVVRFGPFTGYKIYLNVTV